MEIHRSHTLIGNGTSQLVSLTVDAMEYTQLCYIMLYCVWRKKTQVKHITGFS